MLDLLDALREEGLAVVTSTHDLALVRERFPRCVCLRGEVVGDGPPSAVLDPAGVERAWTG